MRSCLSCHMLGIQVEPLQAIALAAAHGFAAVDLPPVPLDQAPALRAALAAHKLQPGAISNLLGAQLADAEDTWQAAMATLDERLAAVSITGFTRAYAVLMPFSETMPYDVHFAHLVARLRGLMPRLEEAGISLAIEYIAPKTRRAPYPHHFIHDAAGLMTLIEAVGSPKLGVLLDSFHWHCAREDSGLIHHLGADRISVVHVNDAIADRPIDEQQAFERALPGATGVIDLPGFMSALDAIGYDGPVTVEPMEPALKGLSQAERLNAANTSLRWLMDLRRSKISNR